jgi:hypothetical protein
MDGWVDKQTDIKITQHVTHILFFDSNFTCIKHKTDMNKYAAGSDQLRLRYTQKACT